MKTFDEALSRIIDEYTSGPYKEEVQKARKEFFGFIGAVHEEDPFFEGYMTAFIEWYIFSRDLTDQDLPPVRLFYRNHFKDLSDDERKIFSDFTKNKNSMFVAKKVQSSFIYLQDLFTDEKLKIENHLPTAGFNTGDIFEAILVPFRQQLMFTKSFFFHPQEAKPFIIKEMKKIRNIEAKILQKVLMRFKRLRLKFDRYPHANPKQIYNSEEFNRYA